MLSPEGALSDLSSLKYLLHRQKFSPQHGESQGGMAAWEAEERHPPEQAGPSRLVKSTTPAFSWEARPLYPSVPTSLFLLQFHLAEIPSSSIFSPKVLPLNGQDLARYKIKRRTIRLIHTKVPSWGMRLVSTGSGPAKKPVLAPEAHQAEGLPTVSL